jgi:hypothetical protein
MPALNILGAVVLFVLVAERPLFAQAAIQEPGAYAFYHPDGDVLNAGRSAFRSLDSTGAFAMDGGFSFDRHASGRPRQRGTIAISRQHR